MNSHTTSMTLPNHLFMHHLKAAEDAIGDYFKAIPGQDADYAKYFSVLRLDQSLHILAKQPQIERELAAFHLFPLVSTSPLVEKLVGPTAQLPISKEDYLFLLKQLADELPIPPSRPTGKYSEHRPIHHWILSTKELLLSEHALVPDHIASQIKAHASRIEDEGWGGITDFSQNSLLSEHLGVIVSITEATLLKHSVMPMESGRIIKQLRATP